MSVLFVREGTAANSSDDHAVVLIKPGTEDFPNYESYWDYDTRASFLLTTKKSKTRWLQAWLKCLYCWDNEPYGGYEYYKQWYAENNWADILGPLNKKSWTEGKLGHESFPSIVDEAVGYGGRNWDFYKDWFKYILESNKAIRGGTDEADRPFYKGMLNKEEEPIWHLINNGYHSNWKARKDASGIWVLNAYSGIPTIALVKFEDEAQMTPLDIPYLVDMNISNRCENACSFCYRGCTSLGEELPYERVFKFARALSDIGIEELVLGGGNVYNTLSAISEYNKYDHFRQRTATTLHWKDFIKLYENTEWAKLIDHDLGGIAVSITDFPLDDATLVKKLKRYASNMDRFFGYYREARRSTGTFDDNFVRYQIVPELMSFADCKNAWLTFSPTLLGLKSTGRAVNIKPESDCLKFLSWIHDQEYNKKDQRYSYKISNKLWCDATFAEKYKDIFTGWSEFNINRVVKQESLGSVYLDPIEGIMAENSHSDIKIPFDFNKLGKMEDENRYLTEQQKEELRQYFSAKLKELRKAIETARSGSAPAKRTRGSGRKGKQRKTNKAC